MALHKEDGMTLKQLWEKLWGENNSLRDRSKQYAAWTIPHIFPTQDDPDSEQQQALNATGAEAVNHLSNVVINTLFNPQTPFFRVQISREALQEILDGTTNDEGQQTTAADIERALAGAERDAVLHLNNKGLRAQATVTAKLLIITGNALFYTNKEERRNIVYSVQDYVIKRNIDGEPLLVITRDNKTWGSLTEAQQAAVKEADEKPTERKDTDPVELFTRLDYDYTTRKVTSSQALDSFDLTEGQGTHPIAECPWIPLVWHLNRGDDYGRGLVEDYAGAFHAIDALTESLVRGLAVMADIKFLVRPGSVVDVPEMNASESGTYHSGAKDDISIVGMDTKVNDFAQIQAAIAEYVRQIARAFLQNGMVTRDAERVTAFEVQLQAQELDQALGGIYSSLADQWQRPLAHISLADGPGFELGQEFTPIIITGIATLTRQADTTQFRFLLEDAALLNNVPEIMQERLDADALWKYLGTNRGVQIEAFLLTNDQVEERRQQRQQAERQAMLAEAGAQGVGAAAEAQGKASVE